VTPAGAVVFVAMASVWSSRPFAHDPAEGSGKEGDPGWVVVDEAAGTFVATIGLGVPAALVAWAVFRAADIFKSAFPGVAAAERLGGGVGITADDLVAGGYGLVAGVLVTLALGA
jgi:phosphatidylglycerophosphatase A